MITRSRCDPCFPACSPHNALYRTGPRRATLDSVEDSSENQVTSPSSPQARSVFTAPFAYLARPRGIAVLLGRYYATSRLMETRAALDYVQRYGLTGAAGQEG